MARSYCLALLTLVPLSALADPLPADCPTDPATMTDMPLAIDLAGRPGVPSGLSGYVFGTAKVAPDGTTCQAAEPGLPPSVLQGDRQPSLLHDGAGGAGILQGSGARDLLRGDDTPPEEFP